jgi:hypothetical protein
MKEDLKIPAGLPKSGRSWKVKQTTRSSAQSKQGVLKHLAKTFEQKEAERQRNKEVKELEREMVEEKKRKILEEKTRREEQAKRRVENEYKNSVYQQVTIATSFVASLFCYMQYYALQLIIVIFPVATGQVEGYEQEATA